MLRPGLIIMQVIFLLAGSNAAALGAEDTVKVAVNVAKTGIKVESDAGMFLGAELAAEKINGQGGLLGKRLELIYTDNRSTPLGAKQAAELAAKMDVIAVVGGGRSTFAMAMAPVLQQAQIPMITHFSTLPDITLIGDYIFRVCYTDAWQGNILGRYAYDELSARKAIVLEMVDEVYSTTLASYFVKSFELAGGEILWQGYYKSKTMDFAEMLSQVEALKPDVVFVPGYSKDAGWIIRQARNMGIGSTFLGGDGWGLLTYSFGGDAVDGSYSADHWHPGVPFAASKELLDRYEKKYGQRLIKSTGTPLIYDAIMVLADAVRRAGSLDRTKIRDAIAQTSGFQGATGELTFDADGDPLNKQLIITRFEGGDKKLVKPYIPTFEPKMSSLR